MRREDGKGIVLKKEISDNYQIYRQRIDLYKKFGYDIEKERQFIIDAAQPLYGDILEIGTGKGHFALSLAKEGYNFVSIDISDQEQSFARSNLEYFGLSKQVDFRIENAENLSFEDNSFDIIFSVNVFHHLKDPFKVLDELIRVISFEGKIILSDFTKEGLKVIDKVHQAEGRRHSDVPADFKKIGKYLLNKGFRVEAQRNRHQETLIAYHQLI